MTITALPTKEGDASRFNGLPDDRFPERLRAKTVNCVDAVRPHKLYSVQH